MRYRIMIEIILFLLFLISVPIILLVEHSIAKSDEGKRIESAYSYMQSGDQFYKQGKLNDASVQYHEALKLDPKIEEAYFALAEIYYENIWNYESLNEIQKLEKLNPKYPGLYLLMGKIYLNRIIEPSKAFVTLQKAIALDPQNSEVNYHLGTIYQQQNKRELAILSYEKSVASTKISDRESVIKSYLQLGRIYKIEKNLDKAIDMLKKALSLNQKSEELISELAGIYSQKAGIYRNEKKFLESAKIYEEIIKLNPNDPENIEYYMELGNIYRSEENYDKAIEMYNAITKLDPLNFDAFSALKELEMLKSGAISQ